MVNVDLILPSSSTRFCAWYDASHRKNLRTISVSYGGEGR